MGKMKFLLVAVVLIIAMSAGAASAADTAANLKAAITVWAWPSADKAFESIIAGFNQKYPGIQVTWEMKAGMAAGTRDALLAALAAGSGGPDVVLIEINDIGMYALHGGFVDLRKPPYNAGKYKSDFVGYKWDLATAPDGAMFAFPWDIGPAGVFYRRDLLDKAGVPSDPDRLAKLIRTWDDFYTVGKKVNDPKNKIWWIDNARGIPNIYFSHKNFFDKDMNIAIDNPTTRKVLAIAAKIRGAGMDAQASLWTNEWYTMLNTGRVATTIVGCWFGGFLKSWIAKDTGGKWGVIPVPEQPLQNWGGSFLAVPQTSENPEAAWKFIEYVCADANAENTIMKTVDYFPAYKPAWKDPLYDESDPFFGGQKTRRLWANIATSQGPFVVSPLDALAEQAFGVELDKFLDQKLDVDATIKAMVDSIDKKTAADRKVVLQLMGKR